MPKINCSSEALYMYRIFIKKKTFSQFSEFLIIPAYIKHAYTVYTDTFNKIVSARERSTMATQENSSDSGEIVNSTGGDLSVGELIGECICPRRRKEREREKVSMPTLSRFFTTFTAYRFRCTSKLCRSASLVYTV